MKSNVYEIENYSYYSDRIDLSKYYYDNEIMKQVFNDINSYRLNIKMIDIGVIKIIPVINKQGYLDVFDFNKKSLIFYGLRNETISSDPSYRLKLNKYDDKLYIRCQIQDRFDVYVLSEVSSMTIKNNKLCINAMHCKRYNCGSWESALSI